MLQKFKITCFDILKGNLYKGRDKLISEKTYISSIPKRRASIRFFSSISTPTLESRFMRARGRVWRDPLTKLTIFMKKNRQLQERIHLLFTNCRLHSLYYLFVLGLAGYVRDISLKDS